MNRCPKCTRPVVTLGRTVHELYCQGCCINFPMSKSEKKLLKQIKDAATYVQVHNFEFANPHDLADHVSGTINDFYLDTFGVIKSHRVHSCQAVPCATDKNAPWVYIQTIELITTKQP